MTNPNFHNRSFKDSLKFIRTGLLAAILMAGIFVGLGVLHAYAAQEQLLESPVNAQRFDTPMPRISGTTESSEVLVFIDGVLNGRTDVNNRKFRYYPFLPLSSGSHEITVKDSSQSSSVSINIIPNPAPVLLKPEKSARTGQDRAWAGGVAQNNSLVILFVDGIENTRKNVKNHSSGTASFGAELKNLPLGAHVVTAIARDNQGKDSFLSNPLIIKILPSTPAPVLNRPVINAFAGIEKPFITGFAKNNLDIYFVINGKIEYRMPLGEHYSGTIAFAWQPKKALSLGRHKIEVFASDNGKLSNNSPAIFWQVGEISDAPLAPDKPVITPPVDEPKIPDEPISAVEPEPEQPPLMVQEPEPDDDLPLTVQEDLQDKEEAEAPVVPDEPEIQEPDDDQGRVVADDDAVLGVQDGPDDAADDKLAVLDEPESDITEIAPGAVVRDAPEQDQEFTFNTSLIIGIVILVFLLLSILVWYIQEKRAELGERVVNIFKEDDEGNDDFDYTSPEDTSTELPKSTYMPGEGHTDSIRAPQEKPDQGKSALSGKDEDKKPDQGADDESSFSGDSFDMPSPPFDEPEPPPAPSFEPPEDDKRDKPEDLPPPPPPMF